MFEKDSFADGRFVVNPFATVSIATGPDFVEEGAVDFVHFCAIDFGESLCHLN